MRSIMLALFTLSLSANAAHAVPTQPTTAKGAAKKAKSDRPKLLSTENGDNQWRNKTYRMPSGRKVTVSSHPAENTVIEVAGPNYTVTNMSSTRNRGTAGGRLSVRVVEDRNQGKMTDQTLYFPGVNSWLSSIENLRSENSTSTVQRAHYWDGGKPYELVLPPGGSQVEDRPVQIDEAQIAKQYNARQKRRADAAKAFGGKVE